MTLSNNQNCPHSETGWCLTCVNELQDKHDMLQTYKRLYKEMMGSTDESRCVRLAAFMYGRGAWDMVDWSVWDRLPETTKAQLKEFVATPKERPSPELK